MQFFPGILPYGGFVRRVIVEINYQYDESKIIPFPDHVNNI